MYTTYNMQLLESVGNLRPIHKPKLTNYAKSHSTNKLKTSHQTLPPPSIRLRLDEAIENAKRNRQSNVFPSQNSNISNLSWRKLKKPIAGNYDSDCNLNSSEVSQISQILHPNLTKPIIMHKPNVSLRGEESLENSLRGYGSQWFKQITREESLAECQKDIHIRCPRGEALDSLHKGQKGIGVSILLDSKQNDKPIDEPHNPIRSLPSNEAYANWQRDRIKEAGSMEQILNQGWSCKTGLSSKLSEMESSQKSCNHSNDDNDRTDHSGVQMAAILGGKLPFNSHSDNNNLSIAPRSIPQSAAANAAREGAGMAERFGLLQHEQFSTGADVEKIEEARAKATLSLDMQHCGNGPRAKFEGIEYANRNRGTLNNSNLHSMKPELIPKQTPRIRPEAQEIYESNEGQMCKLLLTNDKLRQHIPWKPNFYQNTNDIAGKSRGGAAKDCLNPKKTKWCRKIRMTRTASIRRKRQNS
ncbi:hypothetical protein EWB00_002403 [Schistosoma japonicum]|uniref:Uncharacterized protein n=1 Tax=Schistosoma japonicum TaxID=6182 RepID=A0A4Z2DCD8_SCHJA|nr:hypothetical protein EWB00_002403 [Schistosoma japonicum]TNN14167.1 hypothetical protein EWB00_002403 [Schistosoma japonicum]